jgi:hypothetical protein
MVIGHEDYTEQKLYHIIIYYFHLILVCFPSELLFQIVFPVVFFSFTISTCVMTIFKVFNACLYPEW